MEDNRRRWGGLFEEMGWRIGGNLVTCWRRCVGFLEGMWRLNGGDLTAHWRRCGGSLEEMWRLIGGDVAAHRKRCGGSWEEMWLCLGRVGLGSLEAHETEVLCSNLSFISMLLKLCKVVCAMLVNTTGK